MKEIRNGEPTFIETIQPGICKRFGKKAEVTSCFMGTVECRTDLQKTYRFKTYKCSLQQGTRHMDLTCMDECPLIQKEYL